MTKKVITLLLELTENFKGNMMMMIIIMIMMMKKIQIMLTINIKILKKEIINYNFNRNKISFKTNKLTTKTVKAKGP